MLPMPLNCREKFKPPENAPHGADWVVGGLGFEPRQPESEVGRPLENCPGPIKGLCGLGLAAMGTLYGDFLIGLCGSGCGCHPHGRSLFHALLDRLIVPED